MARPAPVIVGTIRPAAMPSGSVTVAVHAVGMPTQLTTKNEPVDSCSSTP